MINDAFNDNDINVGLRIQELRFSDEVLKRLAIDGNTDAHNALELRSLMDNSENRTRDNFKSYCDSLNKIWEQSDL